MGEISNGVWFDTKTNTVVDSQPEEGVQIVAPGQEMNANLEADVKRYQEQGDGNVSAPNPEHAGDGVDPDKTVTTDDVEKTADEDDSKKTSKAKK